MAAVKTPGVYIVEQNAFPDSVVEVPTATFRLSSVTHSGG